MLRGKILLLSLAWCLMDLNFSSFPDHSWDAVPILTLDIVLNICSRPCIKKSLCTFHGELGYRQNLTVIS